MRVEFAVDARGRQPAREFLNALPQVDRNRIDRVIARMESQGNVPNPEHFRRVLSIGDLYEMKAKQVRLFGQFRPGGRFVIAHGTIKKATKDLRSVSDFQTALRILSENDLGDRATEGK